MKSLTTTIAVAMLLSACGQEAATPVENVAGEPSKIFDMPYLIIKTFETSLYKLSVDQSSQSETSIC